MEQLILDSLTTLKEHDDNIQLVYGWSDIGDLICEKQRTNKTLKENEIKLISDLTVMLKKVKLKDDITLYRGITKDFDPTVAEIQFNALSPSLDTALTYGSYIIKVRVPKGCNAFYITAWTLINIVVQEQEETEVLLFPGKFILQSTNENCTTYLYKQY